MPKKILIANTDAQNILALSELFNSLALDDYALFFYSRNENLKKFCQEQKYFYKKSAGLLGFSSKIFQGALLLLLWPFLIFSLYLLAIFKIKYKIEAIICFSWLEKIIFTPWAKMLKLKVIWLACPGIQQKKLNPLLKFLIRVFCARANHRLYAKNRGYSESQRIQDGKSRAYPARHRPEPLCAARQYFSQPCQKQ